MRTRKGFLPWLIFIAMLSVTFWMIIPLVKMGILQLNGDNSVEAITALLKIGMAFFFFLAIWSARSGKEPGLPIPWKRPLLAGFISITLCVILMVIIVNPWGIYGTTFFPTRVNPSRIIKIANYAKLTQTPDLVITGSSPAFTISPEYIQQKLGYSAFNWALDAAKVSEIPVYLEYMRHTAGNSLPKVIMVEVNYLQGDFSRVPLQLFKYVKPIDLLTEVPDRIARIFNLGQVADALYVLNHARFSGIEQYTWMFTSDGFASRTVPDSFEEEALNRQLARIPKCTSISDTDLGYTNEIINLAQKNHSAVVFYLSPVLPSFYDQYIKNDPASMACMKIMQDYLANLNNPQSGIFFLDYTILSRMNGLDGIAGFYDAKHITPANAERLIDAAATTLIKAYQWAMK